MVTRPPGPTLQVDRLLGLGQEAPSEATVRRAEVDCSVPVPDEGRWPQDDGRPGPACRDLKDDDLVADVPLAVGALFKPLTRVEVLESPHRPRVLRTPRGLIRSRRPA
jgi:hypothetical protein